MATICYSSKDHTLKMVAWEEIGYEIETHQIEDKLAIKKSIKTIIVNMANRISKP